MRVIFLARYRKSIPSGVSILIKGWFSCRSGGMLRFVSLVCLAISDFFLNAVTIVSVKHFQSDRFCALFVNLLNWSNVFNRYWRYVEGKSWRSLSSWIGRVVGGFPGLVNVG